MKACFDNYCRYDESMMLHRVFDVSVVYLLMISETVISFTRHDSVYLTCSKKLTGSQLSLPHGINKNLKCETKNEHDRSGPVPLS